MMQNNQGLHISGCEKGTYLVEGILAQPSDTSAWLPEHLQLFLLRLENTCDGKPTERLGLQVISRLRSVVFGSDCERFKIQMIVSL